MPCRIEVRGLTVRFGGVVALNDVSFDLHPGEVVGLIGPNGAGKTTALDVLTGFTKASAGQILLDGRSIERWSPERRARAGMARSWQSLELFADMTVRDNLLAATDRHRFSDYLIDLVHPGRPISNKIIEEVIDEFGLKDVLDAQPSGISHGSARLVGIARAMVTEPAVLLLDEPAAGLSALEREDLGRVIRQLAERRGIGVLVVEHDVALLFSISDRIFVLDFGRKIAEGTPEKVRDDPEVIRAYLGEELSDAELTVNEPLPERLAN